MAASRGGSGPCLPPDTTTRRCAISFGGRERGGLRRRLGSLAASRCGTRGPVAGRRAGAHAASRDAALARGPQPRRLRCALGRRRSDRRSRLGPLLEADRRLHPLLRCDLPARRLVDRGPALGRGPRGDSAFPQPALGPRAARLRQRHVARHGHEPLARPVPGSGRRAAQPLRPALVADGAAELRPDPGRGRRGAAGAPGTARPAHAQPGRLPDRRERHHPGGQLGLRVSGRGPRPVSPSR